MKTLLLILVISLTVYGDIHASDDSAIIDGPNYAFIIAAPKGWKLTSTKQIQAAFYPANSSFEKSAVVMYARSADKKELGISSIPELNRLDLKGIQKHDPTGASKQIGTIKTAQGKEFPVYSFHYSGCNELVAYAEHEKTITAFVLRESLI